MYQKKGKKKADEKKSNGCKTAYAQNCWQCCEYGVY